MAHDAFISHSSKDKAIADGICASLEAAGIRCWIAPRDISFGEDWPTAITNAISQSRVMVLVFSANANSSKQISRELSLAADSSLVIIPFKIDDVVPEPGKQYYLARTHWLDAMSPPTKEQIQSLVERVSAILPGTEPPLESPTATRVARKEERSRLPYLLILGTVIGLMLIAAVVFTISRSSSTTLASPSSVAIVPAATTAASTPTLTVVPDLTRSPSLLPTATPNATRTLAPRSQSPQAAASGSPTLRGDQITILPDNANRVVLRTALRVPNLMRVPANGIAFSPDGSILASGNGEGSPQEGIVQINQVTLWDVDSGRLLNALGGYTNSVWTVAFSPDGKMLAAGATDFTVRVWDLESGKEIRTLSVPNDPMLSVAFSPDGKTVAAAGIGLRLWDVSSGNVIRSIKGSEAVTFSPDGRLLASGNNNDDTVKLWEVDSGRSVASFSGHTGQVKAVAFSPDGKILASGSSDSTVRLWDVNSGRELNTLIGHSDEIWNGSVVFSPDGRILVSGGKDMTIRLWDVNSGKMLTVLAGHTHWVTGISFSPNGKTIATSGADGMVGLWEVATP